MKNQDSIVTPATRKRLETQGYKGLTDAELNDFKFGIRFAYFLCTSLVVVGLLLTSLEILTVAMIVAFFGSVSAYHPFDYLYNYLVRHLINKPRIPHRSKQGRFNCAIATVWLAGIIFLFYAGLSVLGYVAGGILVSVAALVSTTDICIPSMIYNSIFQRLTPNKA